jgi:multimeric flavodoxin WrbA
MKVLTLNFCSNGKDGFRSLLLEPFIEGLKMAGAEVELVDTSGLYIEPCRGCTKDILYESDGTCKCQDDMQKLYPKFRESDIWVFATPANMNGSLNILMNILDRLEPLFQLPDEFPDFDFPNDDIQQKGKMVLISASCTNENDGYQCMVGHFQDMSKVFAREFAGAILRPQAEAIPLLNTMNVPINDVSSAAKKAGYELVTEGKIKTETLSKISRQLLPEDSFLKEINNLVAMRAKEIERN